MADKDTPAEKTETAIVARGTFVVDGADGKPVEVGPGGKVTLPASEIARHRAAGKLKAPDGSDLTPSGIGPTYSAEDGAPVVSVN